MTKENKTILDTVLDNLDYQMTKNMLVKPLPEVIVEKEISTPTPTGEIDEDGVAKYDTVTSIEKVPAMFRKGIVLALPGGYQWPDESNHPEVGDTVVYSNKAATYFDLYKDSQLVNPYNVEAFIRKEN